MPLRRRLALLLAVAALPLALWLALPRLSQGAPSERSARAVERRIDATQAEIARNRQRDQVLTTDISRWSSRIAALEGSIAALRAREAAIQAQLGTKEAELHEIQAELRAERARLQRLRRELAHARAVLARRLVEIYKAADPDVVTVVLDADGFADLLERGEFLQRINAQDARILLAVRRAKAASEAAARRLAGLERRLLDVTAEVRAKRDEVARTRAALEQQQAGYRAVRAQRRALLARVRGARSELLEDLGALRAQQARIQRALLRAQERASGLPTGSIRRGSSGMIWPVNGPITSPFCEVRAWERCHPGVDIGVGSGTPIRAALPGRVIIASWQGGYGNYTCIQHTRTLSTCYAHQSRYATSVGASVRQGQVIGYVGNTGFSFGAHLHFEVRVNGAVTNPLNYL
jgi:murein DD-endopeptidase MepM/ murein hydrolase activator NlpD